MSRVKRIVIAEDHDDTRALLEAALSIEGLEAVLVRDGIEALDIIREQRPDVLLTDLDMPGKDGITLIKEVREQEAKHALEQLPIVVMSANSDMFSDAVEIGAAFCVSKPFLDLFKVIERIKELIRRPLMRESVCSMV